MNPNAGGNPDTTKKGGDKVERRIIAISVSPPAYDEIQKLKGERTWTRWALEMALIEHPDNEVIKAELENQPKKEPKPEKPKKAKKSKEV